MSEGNWGKISKHAQQIPQFQESWAMKPQIFDSPIHCVNNSKIQSRFPVEEVKRGTAPGGCCPLGFSELPSCACSRRVLLLADAFSGRWLGKHSGKLHGAFCTCVTPTESAELLESPAGLMLGQPGRTLRCPSTERASAAPASPSALLGLRDLASAKAQAVPCALLPGCGRNVHLC